MFTFLSYLYLAFVALTSRIKLVSANPESILILRQSRPAVYSFWFQHVVFLMYYFGRHRMSVLMTPQGRTDALTKLSYWMRLLVAKGSFEGGGRHALLTLIEQLKIGRSSLIPADGSRGPAMHCKASCLIVAQETQAPIIPVAWKSFLRIRWPRKYSPIYIPLPFSLIEIRLGSPIAVNRHFQLEDMESVKTQLSNQLNQLRQ